VLVVVEDVHWADEATLDWLTQLGRRIAELPALLVVTFRDDEVGPEHPLRRTLAALPAQAVTRVALSPLSKACVIEQARRAGRIPEIVYRLAGGNPLLVTELLKSDGPAVPGAVQDLVLDRMRALPPTARDLAQLVSVVPTRADAVLVADELDAVDACLAAGCSSRPGTVCRSGTSCCARRWRSRCRRCDGSCCIGEFARSGGTTGRILTWQDAGPS